MKLTPPPPEYSFDKAGTEFLSSQRDLAVPGVLAESSTFPFDFGAFDKPFESYYGTNVMLR
jgi:hypothetical protein